VVTFVPVKTAIGPWPVNVLQIAIRARVAAAVVAPSSRPLKVVRSRNGRARNNPDNPGKAPWKSK
jgi:hypothetical protein